MSTAWATWMMSKGPLAKAGLAKANACADVLPILYASSCEITCTAGCKKCGKLDAFHALQGKARQGKAEHSRGAGTLELRRFCCGLGLGSSVRLAGAARRRRRPHAFTPGEGFGAAAVAAFPRDVISISAKRRMRPSSLMSWQAQALSISALALFGEFPLST